MRRLTDPLPARQSQMVTTSMNSESNSLFQEQLGVGLALSGGELGPISCPYLLLLPQTPFWASQHSLSPSFVRWIW